MRQFDTDSIRRLRKALKLSQEKFGQRLGITKQQVYSLEHSNHFPTVRTLERMMNVFGVEETYFFTDNRANLHDIG